MLSGFYVADQHKEGHSCEREFKNLKMWYSFLLVLYFAGMSTSCDAVKSLSILHEKTHQVRSDWMDL